MKHQLLTKEESLQGKLKDKEPFDSFCRYYVPVTDKIDGQTTTIEESGTKNLRAAVDVCAVKGSGWSLPIQRELCLTYIFNNTLTFSGVTKWIREHWSVTLKSTNTDFVYFSGTNTVQYEK